VGNIPRTLLMIPTWTYVKGKDGLYVNLFIGSTIKVEKVAGTDVEMVQKTDYPWSGKVAITVNPKDSREFTVYVRVPNRTTSKLYAPAPAVEGLKAISVNGQAASPKVQDGYAAITRKWSKGDTIALELPMEAQRIKADEHIAADRGCEALRYGPLIYNVEQADQSNIDQRIGDAPLVTAWRGELLGGVLTIKGQWADGSPLLAIPNYARNNRTETARGNEAERGNAAIDYSGGATTGTSGAAVAATNPSASSEATSRRNRGARGGNSMVWIKDR
jgi:hypothetical protein